MPAIIRGHTQAAAMLIGEKAADQLMATGSAAADRLVAGARR